MTRPPASNGPYLDARREEDRRNLERLARLRREREEAHREPGEARAAIERVEKRIDQVKSRAAEVNRPFSQAAE